MPARGRTGGSSACVINAQPTPGSVQTLQNLGCDHRTERPRSTAKPSELTSPWIASVVAATAATATGAAGTEGIATAVAAAIAAVLPAAGAGTTLTATTGAIAVVAAATTAITTTCSVTAATAIADAITTAAAVATAPGAPITTTAIATTTAATGAAGFGFVDAQRAAHQLGALQGLDGTVLTVVIRHLHEGEAAFAAGVALQGQRAVRHITEGREQLGNILLLSTEGEISNKNAHRPRGPIRQNFSPRRLSRLRQFGGLHAAADNRSRARSSCNRT